jgi:dynein regulatory complex protein 1
MKATYMLNTEKLEYNYRVLTTRDDENTTLLQQHKKRIAKLKETLSNLEARYSREDKKYRVENKALTDAYKQITEQYKELQNKFRHFQSADRKKYQDVWEMNQQIVQEIATKVLQADQVIHQQQLGWEWVPPAEGSLDPGPENDNGVEEEVAVETEDEVAGRRMMMQMVAGDEDESKRAMLELVCQEGGFLVEDRVRSGLAKLAPEEQRLLQIDSIFKALSISNAEDVERLYAMLKAGVDQEGKVMLVHPNDCMGRLKLFVEEQQALGRTVKTAKAAKAAANGEDAEKAAAAALLYWSRMQGIVPEKVREPLINHYPRISAYQS